MLTSSVHNSLARSAAGLGEDSTTSAHFTIALDLVAPGTDVALLSRTRQIRETARMGLLPDAARLLAGDLNQIVARPADHTTRLEMLQAELEVFKGELMLSQARGQLYARPTETGEPPDFLSGLAAKAVSQLGQDLWVLERSQYRRGGYFVEFGATDGVMLSNSWLLEREFGWNGICAEPNPGFLRDLRANRRCQITDACIGATTGAEVEFILADVYGGIVDYAGIDSHGGKREAYRRAGQVVRLTTLSLEDLLIRHDAPREIDYLSIDTEGSEFDILRAFPFADWAIRLITVEHNFTPAREQIHALLSGYGYVRTEAKFDDWYELKS